MDILCEVCNHTTDDGEGFCRFCRTPLPDEPEVIEDEPEVIEDEPEVEG